MIRRATILVLPLLIWAIPAFSNIGLNGGIRNDFFVSKITNQWIFSDIEENKLILSEKSENWRFYADIRLDLLFGGASEFYTNFGPAATNMVIPYSLNLMRLFVRYDSPAGIFTVGKTYVPFGNPGVFNPFEMDKRIDTSDLNYDKPGLFALMDEFSFSDLSGKDLPEPSDGNYQQRFRRRALLQRFQF